MLSASFLTQWSHQSQASQGVKGAENGTEGFYPHWDWPVDLWRALTLRETPGLQQNDMFDPEENWAKPLMKRFQNL